MENNKPKVLILYEYFYPGFRAGGPVQSLTNLIIALQHQFQFYVSTTAFDLTATKPYENCNTNCWQNIFLNNNSPVNVWYAKNKKPGFFNLYTSIKKASPHFIFINGLYTQHFLFPLIFKKLGLLKNIQIILSPRGMLQQGSIQIKSTKKKWFIKVINFFNLLENVTYHATTQQEADDVKKYFNANAIITIAGNIPKKPIERITPISKQKGKLKLISLSLINPVKNIHVLISALKNMNDEIELDIYGPLRDKLYWNECEAIMQEIPANISIYYKGELEPNLVQNTIQQYHVFVSLTKGENFGHALYESLSVGRPILTSFFTPWNKLKHNNAGYNVNIHSLNHIQEAIHFFAAMNTEQLNEYCIGAYNIACDYYQQSNFEENYIKLFSKLP